MQRSMEESHETTTLLVAEAARLFNQFGYAASSLDLVRRELRLNSFSDHAFGDGERLARAAFDYAAAAADSILEDAVNAETTTTGRLEALVGAFRRFVEDPPVAGGSPVFHAAVQSTHAFPFLEERAREIVNGWRHHVRRIVREGIRLGEIKPSAQPEHVASVIVGTMEGAIFLHRIYNDATHLDRSELYLNRFLEQEVRA